jgi:uracil phosphoribosyltransferase
LENTVVIDHPLVQHKLTLMRKRETSTQDFRRLMAEISLLMGYEVTREMPLEFEDLETPLAHTKAPVLSGKKVALITIMRAGQGILDGMLELLPAAPVGHIGLYRDPHTFVAVEYYFKMPAQMETRDCIVVDPLLATGHSVVAAVDRLKEKRPKSLRIMCLLATPEGLEYLHRYHPDVTVYTAAIDQGLDERGFILPGLGDAGDRLYGTA